MVESMSTSWYDANAQSASSGYEQLSADKLHHWIIDLLPDLPATILDVGAGSGRDTNWLAKKGYDVIAAEPSQAMRSEAERLHPDAQVRWIDDSLPDLRKLLREELHFDLITVYAVWMHLPASTRLKALQNLIGLLNLSGILVITLRHGLFETKRNMFDVSLEEIKKMAASSGLKIIRSVKEEDLLKRKEVSWTKVAFRLS